MKLVLEDLYLDLLLARLVEVELQVVARLLEEQVHIAVQVLVVDVEIEGGTQALVNLLRKIQVRNVKHS